ncbi:Ig-like domain repeat protein [Paenibacillus sp. GYB003]|uniref:Ig-like domain repeat protein n=1 Tax=Paenibacillus sp. GYB003 TaxID=2994392 RepID=UPI002F96822B
MAQVTLYPTYERAASYLQVTNGEDEMVDEYYYLSSSNPLRASRASGYYGSRNVVNFNFSQIPNGAINTITLCIPGTYYEYPSGNWSFPLYGLNRVPTDNLSLYTGYSTPSNFTWTKYTQFDYAPSATLYYNVTSESLAQKSSGIYTGFAYEINYYSTGYSQPYLVVDYTPPNAEPNAPSITSPSWGQWLNTRTPTVSWNFSDPDAGNYQSAFYIEIVNSAYSSVLWSSGWINSGSTSYTFPSGAFSSDGNYYVRIKVKDQNGAVNRANGNGPDSAFGNVYTGIDSSSPGTSSHYIEGRARFSATNASSGNMRLVWTYSDLTPQTAYRLVGSNTAWAQWNYDSGEIWNGNNFHDVPFSSLGEGLWYFSVTTRDTAGNWGSYQGDYAIYIDRAAPTISSVSPTVYQRNNGATVSARAQGVTDNLSGVSYVTTHLVRPDGSWFQYNNAVNEGNGTWRIDMAWNGDQQGLWGIDFRAIDAAGNVGSMARAYAWVDGASPSISNVTPKQYLTTAVGGTFQVWAYGATDVHSGVSSVKFPTNGPNTDFVWYDGIKDGATNNWYCNIPINNYSGGAEGLYTTHVYVYDNAGNSAMTHIIETIVDRTAPTISSVQGYSYTNQTSGSRRVWAYGAADAHSGIQTVYCNYKVPGQAPVNSVQCSQSGSDWYADIPLSAQGEYSVDFYALDKAGNWMVGSKTVYFFVDSQRANDPNPSAVWDTTSVELTWSQFSDPAPSSGRKSTNLYFGEWDGNNWVGTPLYNGTDIGDVTSKTITGLTPGKRYRYTVIYYDNAGNQSAYTFFEFVTKKQIGSYPISASGGVINLPLYDPVSGVTGPIPIRATNSAGIIGALELVSITDPKASPVRVSTAAGIRAISK